MTATPYTPKKSKPQPLANKVAERIKARHELFADKTGTIYRHTGTHWVEVTKAELLNWAWEESGGFAASDGEIRSGAAAALAAACFDPAHRWGRVKPHEVAMLNGVLDLKTMKVRQHDPDDRLDRVIPWDYVPGAACATWKKALQDWFGEKSELPDSLRQFFGYILLNHCLYKRAAMLFGPSNSGKSRVVVAAMNLVGEDATCQLSVEDMDDPRRRGVVVGKALNVMTELPTDAMIRDGGFKAIVSGEPLLIDDKFKLPFMYQATAKHIIVANSLPVITDRSEGTFNRLLVIPFRRVFGDDEQDPQLDRKLLEEMPGILAWAVEGARDLVERDGGWFEAREAAAALATYRRDQNPVASFLEECCVQDVGAGTPLSQLVKQFNAWHRGSRRLSIRGFAELLRRHLRVSPDDPDPIRKIKRKDTGNQSVRCLLNWKFVGLPKNYELRVSQTAALSTTAELEAEGTAVMAGEENPQ